MNAMFQLRSKVLQYGRDHLIKEGFQEINSPKIIAAAAEGGTNLFPMKYFETEAYLSQSPQLYKQLAVLGGLERVFEIGPAFRAEKHDTYRHLNEFISFDIEGAWMDDEDVMGVLERMIHHIWSSIAADESCNAHIDTINAYRATQNEEPIEVIVPELPFPRLSYCDAIATIKPKAVPSNGVLTLMLKILTFLQKTSPNSTSFLDGQWNLSRFTSTTSKVKMEAQESSLAVVLILILVGMNSPLEDNGSTEWMS